MARKSVPFRVAVHVPVHMDCKRMQASFDEFYIGQVKKMLGQSKLDKSGKIEILDRIIAHHTKGAHKEKWIVG